MARLPPSPVYDEDLRLLDLQYVRHLESLPFGASNGHLLVYLNLLQTISKEWRSTSLPFHIADLL